MAHSSRLVFKQIEEATARISERLLRSVNEAEEFYHDLLEAYAYNGGTDLEMAKVLFQTDTPTLEEQTMIEDLRNCVQAMHQMYQCMNNVTVTQENRAVHFRRFT